MSQALTIKQAIALSECWRDLAHNTVFVVTNGREFLVEPPDERQDRDDDDDEAVLRVFVEHEDAWLYCEQQQNNYATDVKTMHVTGTSLDHLFSLRRAIINNGIIDFGVGVRLDACTLRSGEPVVLDTLWSSTITPN